MRKIMLIRWGVLSAVLAGGVGGALAVGCGGSSGGGPNNNNSDSGEDSSMTLPGDDSGMGEDGSMTTSPDGSMTTTNSDGGDAGADADSSAPPPPEHGKLILVHAAGYAPPMRFCFGFVGANGTTIAPTNAAPDTAIGLPPGLGGPAADTPNDIATQTIEVYGIVASAIASETPDAGSAELTCKQLIGDLALLPDAGGLPLVQGRDYFDLGQLPAGTIADKTTTLLAVTGCFPGLTSGPAIAADCPSGYDAGAGDLGLWYKTLDRAAIADGGTIGGQFAQLSLPFQTLAPAQANEMITAAAGFTVTMVETIDAGTPDGGTGAGGDAGGDAGDAGTAAPSDAGPTQIVVVVPASPLVAAGVQYGSFTPSTAVQVPGVAFDGTSAFFVNAMTPDGGVAGQVALPLPAIQALSFPNSDAGAFMNGNNYVFVLLGDPLQPSFVGADGGASAADAGGQFNPLSAHILGFPTDPPFGN